MTRVMLVASVLVLLALGRVSNAEPISTTSCGAAQTINETRQKDGKTYKCTSKTVCKTTTCQTGGTAQCSITTSTSYDCTEVAAGPRATQGGVLSGTRPDKLDPGRSPGKRRPLEALPEGGTLKQ